MIRTLSRAVCRIAGRTMDLLLRPLPPLVRIETTNACNSRCTICPHRAMRRPIRQMDDHLFTRIVDQCAQAGCREIHLHNFGEPLMDDRIAQRVRYAKQCGLPRVKIFSNGSLLDERRARELIDAGLDEIKISFDGATRDEFEEIRAPLQFDRIIENIHRLVALRNQLRSPMKIRVACCSTSDKRGTVHLLADRVDSVAFGKVHNWAGSDLADPRRTIRKPCSRLWRTFTILAGGEVALCCLDYDGQHVLGRIDAGTSLGDVWHSEAYREVRRQHIEARQDEIALCRNCSKAFV